MDNKEIYDLQIKLSYMEDFVQDLNKVIIDQNKENEIMMYEINKLKGKISQLEERLENKDQYKADEAPPHY